MVPRFWVGIASDSEEQLAPDVMLPEQFRKLWHETRAVTPERELALSVIWQAIFDLEYRFATRRRQQRLYMEAYNWVAAEDWEWEFSFARLCQALSIDVKEARTALLDLNRLDTALKVDTPREVEEAA